jgi:VanZ family protein
MAMIFTLSSFSSLPTPPGGLSFYHAHFAAYAGLGILATRALSKGFRRITWSVIAGAIVISTLYGVSDEYHQRFVPGRTFDLLDLLADFAGSMAGSFGSKAWSIIRRRS